MKHMMLVALTLNAIMAAGSGTVMAQDEEAEYPPMHVVEGWTCKYLDGKGPDDLAKANAAWNKWMDDRGQGEYAAAVMTPYFFGEQSFDFAWLGVAKTGTAFGTGTHLSLTEGREIGEIYMKIITCDSHTAWVSMMVDTPNDEDKDKDDKDFVLSFSNCSIKDDHTFEEYLEATKEWDTYAKEHGIKGVGWVWFPVAGEKNNDYDFKFVGAEDDFVELGANWQKFMDGHWRKSNELFEEIVDCDSPRIYLAEMIRRYADKD